MVSTYIIYYRIGEERYTDSIQALSAQHAVDIVRDSFLAIEVIEVSKVVRNWR